MAKPDQSMFIQLLHKYSPDIVKQAILVAAKREADGLFRRPQDAIPYTWGVAKRISERLEAQADE